MPALQSRLMMAASETAAVTKSGVRGRIVLCFDGTGNKYAGDTGDTNVIQLYKMFKRDSPNQYHYYQPGIGTYTAGTDNINVDGFFAKKHQSFHQTMDQGFANSFDEHVAAGYKFLMRYYNPGDEIYIFGFSRGAFTARFLARMIEKIGLLSKGNEEMVPFAYTSYQSFEQGAATGSKTDFHKSFKKTFCRSGVKVHFLGLFDCVRSVANFEAAKPIEIPVFNTYATYVRHAVSIDECRAKFKPALMSMDEHRNNNMDEDNMSSMDEDNMNTMDEHDMNTMDEDNMNTMDEHDMNTSAVDERWFPGNHGDIGGGWKTAGDLPNDVQLSSLALEWMLEELKKLRVEPNSQAIELNDEANNFLARMKDAKTRNQALMSKVHSVLKWNGDEPWWKIFPWRGDTGWVKVLFWKMMEYLPFARKTLLPGAKKWTTTHVPNRESRRPIPAEAILDKSVLERMILVPGYLTSHKGEALCDQVGLKEALVRCQENHPEYKIESKLLD